MKLKGLVSTCVIAFTVAACSSSGSSDNKWGSSNSLQSQVKQAKQYSVSASNFQFNGTNYNGGDKVDLSDTTKFPNNTVSTVPVTINGLSGSMKIYNQPYSVVIGSNLAGNFMVRDYVGLDTVTHGAIPSAGNATYRGSAFSKNSNSGVLVYTVNFTTRVGDGTITGLSGHGTVDLINAPISGSGITGSANSSLGSGNYDLKFFGPNAEEIAGKVTGIGADANNDIGFAGKQ